MPWFALVIMVIAAAVVGFASLITGIVLLCVGRYKTAGVMGGVLLLMVLMGVFSAAGLVGKAVGKGLQVVSEHARESRQAFQKRVDKLKSYVDASVQDKVEEKFFTERGFRDWWRVPLVYPYSITCIDTRQHGSLECEGHMPDGWTEMEPLDHITHLAFDGEYLLVRQIEGTKPLGDPDARYVYRLCVFKTGSREQFASREELFEAAKKRGFTDEPVLTTIEGAHDQYFNGWHDASQDLR